MPLAKWPQGGPRSRIGRRTQTPPRGTRDHAGRSHECRGKEHQAPGKNKRADEALEYKKQQQDKDSQTQDTAEGRPVTP